MQTINRYAPDYCGCVPNGEQTPHTSPDQCSANRAATATMLSQQASGSIDGAIAGAKLHAAKHDTHYRPQHGCPLCPIGSSWVRDGDDWKMPQELGMVLPQN